MLSRFLKLAGLLVVALVALVIAAPYFVPSSVYKDRIETSAEQALGRDVTLTGDVKVRFFPRIEAVAGEAEIANPKGFSEPQFASMTELRAAVKLIPLLMQRVEVDEFVLIDRLCVIYSSTG